MGKRLVAVLAAYLLLVEGLTARLAGLAIDPAYTNAVAEQTVNTVEIARTRGTIYDRAMRPLVNAKSEPIEGENATLLTDYRLVTRTAEDACAVHVIGTLDPEGRGASGIECAYDTLLASCGGTLSIRYALDAAGNVLAGRRPRVINDRYDTGAGVVLTLDEGVQRAAEEAAREMERGAVVVMDVENGDLLAVASRPAFDPLDLASSLEDENAPFLNRAFAAYNVGSTFKLLVAAAALDAGIVPPDDFVCAGAIEAGGVTFHCHRLAGHGVIDFEEALAHSCNPYFISLGLALGGKRLLTAAQRLGFGQAWEFAPAFRTAAGTLPSASLLSSDAATANFAFGQGELTATPVQIACLVSAVANGGRCVTPRLVRGTTADGKTLALETAQYAPVRIFSAEAAETVRNGMICVVENGSGTLAKPSAGGAGGKTASAQTGSLDENGEEIVHAWFSGFYPAQRPQYAIVVLAEGGDSGGDAAAPVFRAIAEALSAGTEKSS